MSRSGLLLCLWSAAAWAGPPFQTDDPEPIDFRHFEFYTFASSDGTPVETDAEGPALELNWGALPNVHLHIIVPAAVIFPSNDPRFAPSGAGPPAYGIGDIEMGIKLRFVQETKHRPMIGTFTMFELPTGNAARGLGVGSTWYKVPLWIQKSFGPWTTYGGAGETVFRNAPGYRNFPFAGWLVQRDLGKKVTLGTEAFYHGPEGPATPQTRPATLIDVGGYYKFRDPGFQLLFCYGHTAVGQKENYAYLGLYWTWGKEGDQRQGSGPGQGDAAIRSAERDRGIVMNVTASDAILLGHAAFGILGTLAALYVFAEALNARAENVARIRRGALAAAISMCVACVLGGIWYLRFYPAEKALILKGPWPMAHNLFMETKEHLFFATLILALYLPIAAADDLIGSVAARRLVLTVAVLVICTGLAIEGAGAVIDHGAKVALLRGHS